MAGKYAGLEKVKSELAKPRANSAAFVARAGKKRATRIAAGGEDYSHKDPPGHSSGPKGYQSTPDQDDRNRAAKEQWRRQQRKKELRYGAGWRASDEQRAQKHPKGLRNADSYDSADVGASGTYKS